MLTTKITCLIVSFQESIRKHSPLSLLKGLLSKYTHFSVIMQLKDKYQPNWLEKNMFCLKAHQLSIVLPSKSRLVQLQIYTNFTKTCFFLGVTCYFSRIPYFWSIVLFRCNDFIRSFILCLNYSKSSNSTTLFCLIYIEI